MDSSQGCVFIDELMVLVVEGWMLLVLSPWMGWWSSVPSSGEETEENALQYKFPILISIPWILCRIYYRQVDGDAAQEEEWQYRNPAEEHLVRWLGIGNESRGAWLGLDRRRGGPSRIIFTQDDFIALYSN